MNQSDEHKRYQLKEDPDGDHPRDLGVFILTAFRSDRVLTVQTLRRAGYTGPIYLLLGSDDDTIDDYRARWGESNVLVFDKDAYMRTSDSYDNFQSKRTPLYARNAVYDVAASLGYRDFIKLDDDYNYFGFRFLPDGGFRSVSLSVLSKPTMNAIIQAMREYMREAGLSIFAMAQGGDYIGGTAGQNGSSIRLLRKAMNFYVLSTDRRVEFLGTLNDDVNTYVVHGSRGLLFMTTTQVYLIQTNTQTNAGGITELYKEFGTYVKSFQTVMAAPSCVRVSCIGNKAMRIHHEINWRKAVPKILRHDV